MIEIRMYEEEDKEEIIELVLYCQNDGTRPVVTVESQPELLRIKEVYLENGGAFWVARDGGKLAGCIGLVNCKNGIGILKKFFVYDLYRSAPHHLGRRLYGELLEFAKDRQMKKLLLDTPRNTERAHRFYEKAGFQKIEESELPVTYDHPYSECDFFILEIGK